MNSAKGLQPWLQPYAEWLIDVAVANGLEARITSTYRSRAEQTRLYRKYLAGTSPFPVAPPGKSLHEYGRAFDVSLNDARYLAPLGALWKRMGGRWWPSDPIHFEA